MKLIILDRDGVINEDSDDYIKSPDEWRPISGSLEAITQLNQAGFTVVVVTNQSGIGLGLYTEETLHKIHLKMYKALEKFGAHIDKIYFCPHTPKDNCNCRKPKTGLFEQLKKDYQIDLKNICFIGDKWQDMQAGLAMDCHCILVKTGYGEQHIREFPIPDNILVVDNLKIAAEKIINTNSE